MLIRLFKGDELVLFLLLELFLDILDSSIKLNRAQSIAARLRILTKFFSAHCSLSVLTSYPAQLKFDQLVPDTHKHQNSDVSCSHSTERPNEDPGKHFFCIWVWSVVSEVEERISSKKNVQIVMFL